MSGGLDSTVTAYFAKLLGYKIYALTFDYGQKHRKEIDCAMRVAKILGVKEHRILKIELPDSSVSALTTNTINVPEGNIYRTEIPSTYVPFRNTILLSYALSWAEAIKADAVFIGANALDYSGYRDCRPMYYEILQRLVDVASGVPIEIKTPIIKLNKREIIELGSRLDVPFEETWSCYQGNERPCLRCDSCLLRAKGFYENDAADPALTEKEWETITAQLLGRYIISLLFNSKVE